MNNALNTNGALSGVHTVILNDDSTKEKKISIITNIIIVVLCIICIALLLIVYHYWQKIPFRNHYFHAEHMASFYEHSNVRAEFKIYDPKILDNDKSFIQSKNQGHYSVFIIPDSLGEKYTESYSVSPIRGKHTQPLQSYSTYNLSQLIGKQLFSELCDSCKSNHLNICDYTEVYYYRHLDNETSPKQAFYKKHQIDYSKSNCYTIYGKNDFALVDSERENKIGIKTHEFYTQELNSNTLSQSSYRNISQCFMLSSRNRLYAPIIVTSNIKSKTNSFIENFLKMEDISQSYYSIRMRSTSIPVLYLKIEFVGTIQCTYTKTPFVDSSIDYENSHQSLNIGSSFIEILKKSCPGDVNFDVLVKFNDMQNMQSFRLFILAALITLCLTQCIKSIVKIIILLITKSRNRKKDNHDQLSENSLYINTINQDNNDDIPEYYL